MAKMPTIHAEGQEIPFIPLILLPSIIFMLGIVLPVESLPEWVQRLSLLTPLYYANEVLRPLIAGESLRENLAALAGLPLYGIMVLVIARYTLRQKE